MDWDWAYYESWVGLHMNKGEGVGPFGLNLASLGEFGPGWWVGLVREKGKGPEPFIGLGQLKALGRLSMMWFTQKLHYFGRFGFESGLGSNTKIIELNFIFPT
ncbi:hypothetical protein Droror1_Dr00017851 [Drosera rotundifolia]